MRLQSDERLAELAIDGHEAAFTAIVDRYRAPLLRYCAGIVGASRAEDAVQQALINAHDALARTTDVRHLRSWLYRIAHNTSLNVLRAVRDDLPLDPARAAADDGPAAAFERTERLRATLDAVRELPERQRAALVLRELEGRSHEEIAAALGVTKGSARQHLMRARTAVRGAVTAFTPYPLIAKLAEALASPTAGSWADAAAGAGAGLTIAKVTAGVMATGALVGGTVGTEHAIHRQDRQADAATTREQARTGTQPKVGAGGPGGGQPIVLPLASTTSTTSSAPGHDASARDRSGRRRGKGDDAATQGRGGSGEDDERAGNSGPGRFGGSSDDDDDDDRHGSGNSGRRGGDDDEADSNGESTSGRRRTESDDRGSGKGKSQSGERDKGSGDADSSGGSGRGQEKSVANGEDKKRDTSTSSGGDDEGSSSGTSNGGQGSGSSEPDDDASTTVTTTTPSTAAGSGSSGGDGTADSSGSGSSGSSGSGSSADDD
jgi:RNA polymerase sigma factor (sigma-70 family)